MNRVYPVDDGPGAVLAAFVRAAVGQGRSIGPAAERMGEAGLHLIAGAIGATLPDDDAAADARRCRVLHYVRTHLTDAHLSHDRVAAAHRMSRRALHRLFEHEPFTVTEYIRLQRLEAARRDLTDPLLRGRTIGAIAARLGFSSPAHFTRAFQAQYGVTPSTLRVNRFGSPNLKI